MLCKSNSHIPHPVYHDRKNDYKKMIPSNNNYESGLTLIEVLIAMVILVVAIVGWINLQQSAVMGRGQSRTMTVAAELVQAKIEDMSTRPGDMYSRFCGGYNPLSHVCREDNVHLVGGFEYTLEWSLIQIHDFVSDSRPFWDIEVEARWNYRGPKSFSAKRIVMERPQ